MVPVDRRQHRQQRVRGAGVSTAQESFDFNFGPLGVANPLLPPQRSGRPPRIPAGCSPRNLDTGTSARQHPKYSPMRSAKSQLNTTPTDNVVSPQSGKRKRGSSAADAAPDNEQDELSPDQVENSDTVDRSKEPTIILSRRRESEGAPDELVDEAPLPLRRTLGNVTGLFPNNTAASASWRRDGARRSISEVAIGAASHKQLDGNPRQLFALPTAIEEDTGAFDEESEMYEGWRPDEPPLAFTPRPIAKRTIPKPVRRTRLPNGKPPRIPKLAIPVMRMKGHGIRGITVADTTRAILEEISDLDLSRMLDEMKTLPDSSRRKEMRRKVVLISSFKQTLDEKLLDLQDANDVLTANSKTTRTIKRGNAELRKEILALQTRRQELALEHDNVQADFDSVEVRFRSRKTLSTNLFDIEAAVQNGRKKAKQERREDEGPDIPLSILLKTASRDVGSIGGGFFANLKSFNRRLERVAEWLEE